MKNFKVGQEVLIWNYRAFEEGTIEVVNVVDNYLSFDGVWGSGVRKIRHRVRSKLTGFSLNLVEDEIADLASWDKDQNFVNHVSGVIQRRIASAEQDLKVAKKAQAFLSIIE